VGRRRARDGNGPDLGPAKEKMGHSYVVNEPNNCTTGQRRWWTPRDQPNHRAMSFWPWAQPSRSQESAQTVTMVSWASKPAVQPNPSPALSRCVSEHSGISVASNQNPTPRRIHPSSRTAGRKACMQRLRSNYLEWNGSSVRMEPFYFYLFMELWQSHPKAPLFSNT
jgi:hypothetical protein